VDVTQQARDEALSGLASWAASEADLPHAEAPETAAARLLGVAEGPAGPQVQIASDGLSLDRKLAIEQAIRTAARGKAPSVYFRRAKAGPAAGSGPAPVAARPSPFGLKLDRRAIPGVREVIVVASGKGGVGKSTVAVNLAVALAARGGRVGLLDADVYGPSAPHMLGLTGGLEVTAADRLVPREAFGVKTVSFGFLTDVRQPVIWRGPLVTKALRQLCFEVDWGDLTHLVVDLPPGTGDVQLTLIESLPIHGAIIVTTPTRR
jgi:ATP-binding protein involved in chromosome partitioning